MKKIGMIDLHIDEWHANHYPEWFRTAAGGEAFELAGAWEESPAPGGKPLETWCREMGIPAEHNLERLVENCDVLCILAPSNPEVHERLAEIPLASGKPVYLDKPFAPDRATAERLFARAERYHTPLFSSSALRFSEEWLAAGDFRPQFLETRGGGSSFEEYGIHQFEMVVSMMGTGIIRLEHRCCGITDHLNLTFADGRGATLTRHPKLGFSALLTAGDRLLDIPKASSNMFPNLIAAMLKFFDTGIAPVPREETIAIAGLVEASAEALRLPGGTVELVPSK